MTPERERLVAAVRLFFELRPEKGRSGRRAHGSQCWVPRGPCKPGEGRDNSCGYHQLRDALAAYDRQQGGEG